MPAITAQSEAATAPRKWQLTVTWLRSSIALLTSLSALLLLAGPAAAQTSASPRLGQALDAPWIELESPGQPPPASPDDPAGRAFLGPLAGIGLIAAATAVGAMFGAFIGGGCDPSGPCLTGALAAIGAAFGASVGLAALYPLGVALGADAAGGRGRVGASYLGGLIGTALGVGLYFAAWGIQSATGAPWAEVMVPAIVLGSGLPLVGPVIGYELSDHAARGPARGEVSWRPTLGVEAHGARAGVVGSF